MRRMLQPNETIKPLQDRNSGINYEVKPEDIIIDGDTSGWDVYIKVPKHLNFNLHRYCIDIRPAMLRDKLRELLGQPSFTGIKIASFNILVDYQATAPVCVNVGISITVNSDEDFSALSTDFTSIVLTSNCPLVWEDNSTSSRQYRPLIEPMLTITENEATAGEAEWGHGAYEKININGENFSFAREYRYSYGIAYAHIYVQ